MRRFIRLILVGVMSMMALGIMGCGEKKSDFPTTGALTMPDYAMEISGTFARFDSGTVMLLSDEQGAIVLDGDMNFDGLNSGDRLTIYCDEVMETYPAQTTVKEMVLTSRGTVSDLPKQMMETLKGLGYEMKEYDEQPLSFSSISMSEAKAIFEQEGDYIILDVRRADEFAGGHIPGAINVANESIADTCPAELPDKDQLIYVYCRSGNRSKQAAKKLVEMGYTNIVEFGGILDWTGDIEK